MVSSLFMSYGTEPRLVLDVRSYVNFALKHYPGSINISLSPTFSFWADLFIPSQAKVFIVSDTQEEIQTASQQLSQIGKTNVSGGCTWKELSEEEKASCHSFELIDVKELSERIKVHPKSQLIDVRTLEEWKTGHISEARHIDLRQLIDTLPSLSIDEDIYLICASGNRSSIAASLMQQQGSWKVKNVRGGMQAWRASHFPILN